MTYFVGLPSLAFDGTSESSGGSSGSNRTQSVADSGYLSDCMSPSHTTAMQHFREPNDQLSTNVSHNGNYNMPLIPLTCEENSLPVKVDKIEPVEILVPQRDYDLNNNFLEHDETSLSPASRGLYGRGSRGSANHKAATIDTRSTEGHNGMRSLSHADRGSRQGQQQKTPVKRGRKLGQGKVPKN